MGISVAIITLNEETNLRRTLQSVLWVDEIVVVDSGSTDGTVSVAKEYGAIVTSQSWLGFSKQKNLALSLCRQEWTLSLDADEVVSDELCTEIQDLLKADNTAADAFFVNRRNYFLGRWIKHAGFYPDEKLRLFRRGVAMFEERAVHESIHYDGRTAYLRSDLYHFAYPTLAVYLAHMNRYSSLASEDMLGRGKTASLLGDVLLRPTLTFFYNYFLRLGFLDGREGLLLNLYHAMYVSSKYAKLQGVIDHKPNTSSSAPLTRELDSGMFPSSWKDSSATKEPRGDKP